MVEIKEIVALKNWYWYSDQLYYVELELTNNRCWSGYVTHRQWQKIRAAEIERIRAGKIAERQIKWSLFYGRN